MAPDFLTAEEIRLQMFCWEILCEKIKRKSQKEVIHTSALKERIEAGCQNKQTYELAFCNVQNVRFKIFKRSSQGLEDAIARH